MIKVNLSFLFATFAKWNGKLTFMIVFSAIDENMGKW